MTDLEREHPYLPVPTPTSGSRTFLGGFGLRARTLTFVVVGLLGIAAFSAIAVHVDDQLSVAQSRFDRASEVAATIVAIERGVADLRSLEQQYVLTRDASLGEEIEAAVADTVRRLDRLAASSDADGFEHSIATLRDGIVQYEEQFSLLGERSPVATENLRGQVADANEGLAPRLKSAKSETLMTLLSEINQLGSEIVLTGDPSGLEDLQTGYKDLSSALAAAKLPKPDKDSIATFLDRHQTAMMALITARVRVNEESERFEDIQAYMQPSVESLRHLSTEVREERLGELADARRYAVYMLTAGAAAVILWTVVIGLVVVRSVTIPTSRLARVARQLIRGDRTIRVPGRGNSDASGDLARAFDQWIAALSEADHLREDLEHARAVASEAEDALEREQAKTADAEGRIAALQAALDRQKADMDKAVRRGVAEALVVQSQGQKNPSQALQGMASQKPDAAASAQASDRDKGIAAISEELARFSETAAQAASGVEQTETLIAGVHAATEQLDLLKNYVVAIRDQTNFLLFGGPRDAAPNGAEDTVHVLGRERDGAAEGRLNALRTAAERGEQVLDAARREVDVVTQAAERLQANATEEAKQATARLLARSAQLQTLLGGQREGASPEAPSPLQETAQVFETGFETGANKGA